MNIQKKPFSIDFVGNNPEFVIMTDPYDPPGRRYSRTFAFSSLTVGNLTISTPYGNKIFPVTSGLVISSDPSPITNLIQSLDAEQAAEQLYKVIKYDRYLTAHYDIDISVEGSSALLTLTDKEYKNQDDDITITSSGSASEVTVVSTTPGSNRVPKNRYRVMCQFEVLQNGTTKLTPEFFLDDNDGTVCIGTSILSPFFENHDVPTYRESSGVYPCHNSMIDVRLLYSESVNDNQGFVFMSPVVSLANGTVDQYARDNNIADWVPVYNDKFYQHTKVDIFGMDIGGVVVTDCETEQYVYVCNFTGSDKTVNMAFVMTTKTGSQAVTEHAGPFNIPVGVSRVPSSIFNATINPSEVVEYRFVLSITGQSRTIERKYVIVPRGFSSRTMMFLNRMNLYETFIIDNVAKECNTEGERATTGKTDAYVISDFNTQYTARTGFRTSKQIALLRDALSKSENLILDGRYAYKISIMPGSYKILDDDEDLLNVEFKFMLGDKIDRSPAVVGVVASNTSIDYTDTLIH